MLVNPTCTIEKNKDTNQAEPIRIIGLKIKGHIAEEQSMRKGRNSLDT
jgi:hypothetical protein